MPRYFFEISYDGSQFHGWQRQNDAISVQQSVEEALSMIYRKDISIVGCGRTDTGVHASSYFFHTDLEEVTDNTVFRANSILPKSIVVHRFQEVSEHAHARFDAIKRGYVYYAHWKKNPFLIEFSSRIVELRHFTLDQLNETASLLLNYNDFTPFCKAHGDNKTMLCRLTRCEWEENKETGQFILHVESDRFLRGMIRLIVGTCVLVAKGELSISDVREALEDKKRLPKSLSAPPQGLFLNKVEYEYIKSI